MFAYQNIVGEDLWNHLQTINTFYVIVYLLFVPTSVLTGSHSYCMLLTYIKGEMPFPEFSATFMLDDVIVGHYNTETKIYIARGNTSNEDDVVDPNHFKAISEHLQNHLMDRSTYLKPTNSTEGPLVYQLMGVCELFENAESGQLVTKGAFGGSTTDELRFSDGKFTIRYTVNYTAQEIKPFLDLTRLRHEHLYYPACIETLRKYLKTRGTQVNRKVKPRVRLIQRASSDSGRSCVICLATGFYPRHINLTLFRDEQLVADHEITGGDLLPNGDGTYQMRKSLEISAADKHKYTCSASHLSLDNKLDVTLEFDPGEPFKSVISSVLIVLALVLVFGIGVVIYKCRRRRAASLKSDYSSASTSEERIDPAS
ncbi:hypothetical protein QQF64_022683 [Cirrhinus molitorella]|uniref:Ig-like domain-containing protein n=1 Tax=Cirrhinus molitorella TaxID=172907 RepID=A0ABR3L355_9TELE